MRTTQDPTKCNHRFKRIPGYPRYTCSDCDLTIPDWMLTSLDSAKEIAEEARKLKFYDENGYFPKKGDELP